MPDSNYALIKYLQDLLQENGGDRPLELSHSLPIDLAWREVVPDGKW